MGTSRRDLRTSGDLVMAPRVPHGLAAAVEGLTREVIRQRPEDIYVFAAQHFEDLLRLRDEYGAVTNLPGKSSNTAALREMNQSLKKKSSGSRTEEKDIVRSKDHGGWSMNETARVLERHRSIFGDKGRKVSPAEVRALGNEKENNSRRRDDIEKFVVTQKRRGSNERFVKRKILTKETEVTDTKSKSDSNGNPKIISQIPTLSGSGGLLAKDIKSELRKNRNSSRDGRSIRDKVEKKSSGKTAERFEVNSRNSGSSKKTLMRSSRERSLDKLIDKKSDGDICEEKSATDNQKHKTDAKAYSRSLANMPRTLSMDRVREFVVEKFRSSESWEELRSTNYVDRIQEVIDDATPSIRRKVKEIRARTAGQSRGYESVDESTSTSTRSDKSNQTEDVRSRSAMSVSRRSRKLTRRRSKSKSKISGADSLEGIETLGSEIEQPKETRNEVEIGKLKETRSPLPGMSTANEDEHEGRAKSANKIGGKNTSNGFSGESDVSDPADISRKVSASSSISLPAVRPPSSKNQSRSVSRSDSEKFVLPPIPPEVPKSAKQREELILPNLQVSTRTLEVEEPKGIEGGSETPEGDAGFLKDTEEVELNLPDAPTEEIFKDSLNVTPDINVSPRPDSLESCSGKVQTDEIVDNIAELKSQLNEIDSKTGNEMKFDFDKQEPKQDERNVGITERLKEIEETEKRIEKILKPEDQETQNDNGETVFMKKKLIEIQEAEERLKAILDTETKKEETEQNLESQEIHKDKIDSGMKEKLIEIEETEKRIEKILHTDSQETQNDTTDVEINEKPMDTKETETKIEKNSSPESQELKYENNTGIKDKLMEIEETEKRIEKIFHTESQGIQKDKQNNADLKEKIIEIDESERSIEKILPSDTQEIPKNQTESTFVKEKLIQIEEASKRLQNVLIFSGEEKHNQVVTPQHHDRIENQKKSIENVTVIPKTPFIPEIPSEYVSTTDKTNTIESPEKKQEEKYVVTNDQNLEQLANVENADKKFEEENKNEKSEFKSKTEEFPSEPPNSSGNSYILTEGSPYKIPNSVTTVIFPERQLDTPSSDVIEDDGASLKSFRDADPNENESSEEIREISLRNILDNFGEVVQQDTPIGSSTMDVDFIRGLKTGHDVVIVKKDLGQIREENDKELIVKTDDLRTSYIETSKNVVTPSLEDIAETEEILDSKDGLERTQNSSSNDPLNLENKNGKSIAEEVSKNQETKSFESSEPEQKIDEVKILKNIDSSTLEKTNENSDDEKIELEVNHSTKARDTIKPEIPCAEPENSGVTSPIMTTAESLQQGVTDSATTESTDENKETTISDDGGNTAPESSMTSPSCAENTGARNSESSNEVKETTISDQPVDEISKNMYNVVPQCHGSMPHVPELNLDSLQDITVSSFQLSDDATADEDCSDAGQAPSQNDNSLTTETEELHESQQNQEPIHEEVIVKEQVIVKEDPCTKATAYVTEPDTELIDNLDIKIEKVLSESKVKETENLFEDVELISESQEITAKLSEQISEKTSELSGKGNEEKLREITTKVPGEIIENVSKEIAQNVPTGVVEKISAEVTEEVVEMKNSKIDGNISEQLAEKKSEELTEKLAEEEKKNVSEEIFEEGTEIEKGTENKTESASEEVTKKITEGKAENVSEKLTEKIHEEITEKVPQKLGENTNEKISEKLAENVTEEVTENILGEVIDDTVSLKDFKALEARVESEFSDQIVKDDTEDSNNKKSLSEKSLAKKIDDVVQQADTEVVSLEKNSSISCGETLAVVDPPKAEIVTNDLDDGGNYGERMKYHIYVPEVTTSEDSTTETSTFNSAATKIQAGIRGFLTRRRLQSAQRRSSTLDSVPSIQDSFTTDAPSHLEPIEEVGLVHAATTIQSSYRGYKARQRLRREDAVQKTTMSVENPFSGNGLQHTGEFHDCLPLPPMKNNPDERKSVSLDRGSKDSKDDSNQLVNSGSEERGNDSISDGSKEIDEDVNEEKCDSTDSTIAKEVSNKEESIQEDKKFGIFMKNHPYIHQAGLNLVLISSHDTMLQNQYLNFITSIEEIRNENDSIIGINPSKAIEDLSIPKSNVGIESLPVDETFSDLSGPTSSIREPLAVPGTPTGVIIEELSKTDDESMRDITSVTSTDKDVKSRTNLAEGFSEIPGDSLDLPGLSLEEQGQVNIANHQNVVASEDNNSIKDNLETGRPEEEAIEETFTALASADTIQDGSLGTMSFSMNVDDMLGLGGESEPSSNMKPILEVTVTPRDLLKLTNRSEGSQASGDRVESPVTMMQIVPKSVEEKSDRSEEEKTDEVKHLSKEILKEKGSNGDDMTEKNFKKESSKADDQDLESSKDSNKKTINVEPSVSVDKTELAEESSEGTSKTFSIDKNDNDLSDVEKKSTEDEKVVKK